MAIQLNDRDQLIFKLIDEHQVLLEKHISWFISGEDKPVLIRDRLRKLFYLDYLLCHRHGTKLPWWTTPTKPLVYMLSPMSRNICGAQDHDIDLYDSNVQRHLLEVANLRMMYLIGVNEGDLSAFEWTTCKIADDVSKRLDAIVKFTVGSKAHKVGISNHPDANETLVANIEKSLATDGIDSVLIVSRDEMHQQALQAKLAGSSVSRRCVFATHHELYKHGIAKSKWQCADQRLSDIFGAIVIDCTEAKTWTGPLAAVAI